ncbi:hypothetical protein AAHB60_14900 [Pseudomonas aeruginosa]
MITDALDSVILRPNIGVLGRRTATILRRHPKIVKAYNGSLGDEGMVPMAFLQELLELDAIYVGEARLNIARPGTEPEPDPRPGGRTRPSSIATAWPTPATAPPSA